MMKGVTVDLVALLRDRVGLKNQATKEFLAEFLGTFILIIFGDASVAQSVLTGNQKNDYFSVVYAWALGVTFGVMVAGRISGGHLNPAVTLSMAVWGKFSWAKVPVYMIAQYLGAFTASACIFGVYKNALDTFEDERSLTTAGIWATYPGSMVNDQGETISSFLSGGNGFGDQVFGTMLLLICVCAITDKKNMNIPQWLTPLMVGFSVLNIGLSFGMNSGFAINPARDLGPRIFTLMAGWGTAPFTATTVDGVTWWWIPVVACHIGAILGVTIYAMFIEIHHIDSKEEFNTEEIMHEDVTSIKQISSNKVSASHVKDMFQIS